MCTTLPSHICHLTSIQLLYKSRGMRYPWSPKQPCAAEWSGKHVFITGEASHTCSELYSVLFALLCDLQAAVLAWKRTYVSVVAPGGSEGIGYALAELFVEQGARVTLASRSKDKLKLAQARLLAGCATAQVLTCAMDVGSWEQASPHVAAPSRPDGNINAPAGGVICSTGKKICWRHNVAHEPHVCELKRGGIPERHCRQGHHRYNCSLSSVSSKGASPAAMLPQVQASVSQAEAQFGPLDVVIANAGMPSSSAL